MSVYKDFIDYLELIELYDDKCHNKSDLEYTYPNGNRVVFTGLDDREKIKSTQWGDIWLEEASDFSLEDVTFLKTRLYRGKL
jgi:phage terminase large subunit